MNKDNVKGAFRQVKGRVKEEIGYQTGNDETAAQGRAEQFLGKVQRGFGNLKDAIKLRVDKILESGEPPSHRKAS